MTRLNLACGKRPHEGYTNIDIVEGCGDLQADCLDLAYFPGTVDEILSEHFIEHLTRQELGRFFEQAHRLLRVGGKLILSAPCMHCAVQGVLLDDFQLDLLDNMLFARHLHRHDFHKQGIWEEKLVDLCKTWGFSEPTFEKGEEYEITMRAERIEE